MGKSLTIFMWGYWGWGNATRQLLSATDVAEGARGFKPPMFVDVRISRSVRAKGFNGKAFHILAGESRYRWMPALGNRAVRENTGQRVTIQDPSAANDLLDLALERTQHEQRIVFFCSCEFPKLKNDPDSCHRVTVAELILKYARERNERVEIVEWPGGEPHTVEIQLDEVAYRKLIRGGKAIPLDVCDPYAGLPWGSIARVRSSLGNALVMIGPAKYSSTGWYLPVCNEAASETITEANLKLQAQQWRYTNGLDVLT